MPVRLAIRVERRKNSLRALHIDVPGFFINGRAGSGIAQINGVTQKIVAAPAPEQLATLGIKTRNSLLQIGPLAQITHDVKFTIGDHRRALPREIRYPPPTIR